MSEQDFLKGLGLALDKPPVVIQNDSGEISIELLQADPRAQGKEADHFRRIGSLGQDSDFNSEFMPTFLPTSNQERPAQEDQVVRDLKKFFS